MNMKQLFQYSIRNLCANKLRFFHSMLGMIVGVAALVLIAAIANMQSDYMKLQSNEYNPALLEMRLYTSVDLPMKITPNDMEQLAENNSDVISGISPYIEFEFSGGVRCGDITADNAQVYGVGSSYLDMIPALHLQEGRFFEYMDIARERKVCVIGSGIADDLFASDALGEEIKIWGDDYTVVGIFAEVPNSLTRNTEVYIPYTNARKILGEEITPYNNYMYIYYMCASDKENMYDTQVLIKEMLQQKTGREENAGWILQCYAMGNIIESVRDFVVAGTIQFLLFSIIILIIGGVGIMNVMLASVQARTKEIGIRKAFGATNKDIQHQFTIEAVITSLIGGASGIVFGFVGTYIICSLSNLPLNFLSSSVLPILVAFMVSVLIGVLFGTYPAQQAAKLEPVAAINSD